MGSREMKDTPSIKEIGTLARKIDLGAFALIIHRDSPERTEAIERRMKALTESKRQLQHAR